MKKYFSIFKNMNLVDWVLAVLIITLVAYVVNVIFPPNGWMIGIVAALLLLYLAKRRRDHLTKS
ncbi:MAG: hypothetical protein CVU42_00830 [Chloroflexi bacterium HGW-Chloroflexi-4]|nr:MAG: hypothetical protein CVU42_00830 [Chloroflexi bacterium HGW-Chloroflexi-4]